MSITTDPQRFELPDESQLRELRIIADLSVREVAERGGWSTSTIVRWEGGHVSPRLADVEELLEIYQGEMNGQQQLACTGAL